MLATGPGTPPVVRVWTGRKVGFGCRTVQRPNRLFVGGPNPAPYPSTGGFRQVRLDASGPISSVAFRVVQFMVAFRYLTVSRNILTMVRRCSFWINWPPLWSQYVDKLCLPHPGNERQRSVNNFRSGILGNWCGHWLQLVIIDLLAFFIGKSRNDTVPAPSWKWASNERQRFKVSHLG